MTKYLINRRELDKYAIPEAKNNILCDKEQKTNPRYGGEITMDYLGESHNHMTERAIGSLNVASEDIGCLMLNYNDDYNDDMIDATYLSVKQILNGNKIKRGVFQTVMYRLKNFVRRIKRIG